MTSLCSVEIKYVWLMFWFKKQSKIIYWKEKEKTLRNARLSDIYCREPQNPRLCIHEWLFFFISNHVQSKEDETHATDTFKQSKRIQKQVLQHKGTTFQIWKPSEVLKQFSLFLIKKKVACITILCCQQYC